MSSREQSHDEARSETSNTEAIDISIDMTRMLGAIVD